MSNSSSTSRTVSRTIKSGAPAGYYAAVASIYNDQANRDIMRIGAQYKLMSDGLQLIGNSIGQGLANYYQYKLEQNRLAEESRRWDLGYQLQKKTAEQETQRIQFQLDDLTKAANSEKLYRGKISEFMTMAENAASFGEIDADEVAGRMQELQRNYYEMAPAERDMFNQARAKLEDIRINWDDGNSYSLLQTVNAAAKKGSPMYYSALAALSVDSHVNNKTREWAGKTLDQEINLGESLSNKASATFARDRARAYRNAMSISPEAGRAFLRKLARVAEDDEGDSVSMRQVIDEYNNRHEATVDPGMRERISNELNTDSRWKDVRTMGGVGDAPGIAAINKPGELADLIRSSLTSLPGNDVTNVAESAFGMQWNAAKTSEPLNRWFVEDVAGGPKVREEFEKYTKRFFKTAAQANNRDEFNMSFKWAEDMAKEWAKFQRDAGLIESAQIDQASEDFLADLIGRDDVIRRNLSARERMFSRYSQKTVDLFNRLRGRTSYSSGREAPARDAVPAAAVPKSLEPPTKGMQ